MSVSLASLALIASGAVRLWTDCPFPCLERIETPAGWSVAASAVLWKQEPDGFELALTRAFDRRWGAFQPVAGLSLTSGGDVWAGAGLRWRWGSDRLWLEASFMPGLYAAGDHDLGHPVEFRSALALVWGLDDGATLALTVDHRSNGNLGRENPGMETVGLRWSWPLD